MHTVRSFLRIYLIPLSCAVREGAAVRNCLTLVRSNQSEAPSLRRSLEIWRSYRSVNERAAWKSPMPNTDASTRRRRHEWCTSEKERQWPVILMATKKRASRPDLALEYRPFAVGAIETGNPSSGLLQKVLFWFPNRRDPVHAEIALQTRRIEDLQWTSAPNRCIQSTAVHLYRCGRPRCPIRMHLVSLELKNTSLQDEEDCTKASSSW